MIKQFRYGLYALLVLMISLLLYVSVIIVSNWWMPMGQVAMGQSVRVYPNMSLSRFVRGLQAKEVVDHPDAVYIMAELHGYQHRLQFGEYQLTPALTVAELFRHTVTGQGLVSHAIRFLEGWTFKQFRQALAENDEIRHSLTGLSNAAIMQRLGESSALSPEGLFFPDTYHFVWGNTDLSVLQTARRKMKTVLQQQWQSRAVGLWYRKPYQALIVASLVEAETPNLAERPIIAGIILNRLKKGMRLQIDPTVLYGLSKPYGTALTKQDLRQKNAYNTYWIRGLPPTPIDMPSQRSIVAALHPEKTPYYYFVAKGDGTHRFSRTYRQQQLAVKQYRRRQQQQAVKASALPWMWQLPIKPAIWLQTINQLFHWLILY